MNHGVEKNQMDELEQLMRENLRYVKSIHEFSPKSSDTHEEDTKKLLQELLEYAKASHANTERFMRWIFWNRVFFFIKIIIIIVPIILGIIYLPPLLQTAFSPYLELLGDIPQ